MLKHHTFTVDDFTLMAEAGVFNDQNVELLEGLIYDMSPANPDHENNIDELHERFVHIFGQRARVRSQNALDISDPYWLPHPDIMLLKRRNYSKQRPKPEDVLLLIEMANTSFVSDTKIKLEKYARGQYEQAAMDCSSQSWQGKVSSCKNSVIW
jgi:Uma2 family endonuclease